MRILPRFKTTLIVLGAVVLSGAFWYILSTRPSSIVMRDIPAGAQTETSYTDSVVGLSFEYPAGYTVTGFDDFGGRVILVKNATKDIVLQIFVSERSNPSALTLSEIKAVPGMKIGQSKQVTIGVEQAPATAFQAVSEGVSTQEVWFVRDSLLYQVSAYRTDAPLLPIIDSLIWQ